MMKGVGRGQMTGVNVNMSDDSYDARLLRGALYIYIDSFNMRSLLY